jgi:hypothetical protein
MINWLNKQNKHHNRLFQNEYHIHWSDNTDWFELALMQNAVKLNKRTSKISPRKHRKQARMFLEHMDISPTADNIIEEVFEMLDGEE